MDKSLPVNGLFRRAECVEQSERGVKEDKGSYSVVPPVSEVAKDEEGTKKRGVD